MTSRAGVGRKRAVLRVSSENAWFQKAEAVKRSRRKRWQHRMFFVEDVRSIHQLAAAPRFRVEALLYARGRRLSSWAQGVLEALPSENLLELAPELMAALSDKDESPSELQALVRIPDIDGPVVDLRQSSTILLLDRPGNPGNLGSVIRSADAFGAGGVVISGHAVDPFDPVVVRASAGAFFQVPLMRLGSRDELLAWFGGLRRALPGRSFVGTSARAPELVFGTDLTRPVLLMLGNETRGLSDWLKSQCDRIVGLPARGVASSLNLACAATAFLLEIDRQRAAMRR